MDDNLAVKFRISQLNNKTWHVSVIEKTNNTVIGGGLPFQKTEYDDEGALYYVIAVLFMYGFSIILMIGSLTKKGQNDGMGKYMEDLDKIRTRENKRQQKYKTRLAMHNNKKVARAIERRLSAVDECELKQFSVNSKSNRLTVTRMDRKDNNDSSLSSSESECTYLLTLPVPKKSDHVHAKPVSLLSIDSKEIGSSDDGAEKISPIRHITCGHDVPSQPQLQAPGRRRSSSDSMNVTCVQMDVLPEVEEDDVFIV